MTVQKVLDVVCNIKLFTHVFRQTVWFPNTLVSYPDDGRDGDRNMLVMIIRSTYFTHVYLLALLRELKYHCLLALPKGSRSFWTPKNYKGQFRSSGHSEIYELFLGSVITGCNFHFNQCMWRQIENIRRNGGIQRK